MRLIWSPSRAKQVVTRCCNLWKTFVNIWGAISTIASIINCSRTSILSECRAKMRSFVNPQRKKYGGVTSGLHGGHNCLEIMRISRNALRNLIVDAAVCAVAPSCWNQQYHLLRFRMTIKCVPITRYRSAFIISLKKKDPTTCFLEMTHHVPTFCGCNPFSTNVLGSSMAHRG